MPMLESEKELTLSLLNQTIQAWLELEYHRTLHRELADTPLKVALSAPSVGRPAPDSATLKHMFRTEQTRTQRRSDGTISVGGVRFELPSRYRTLLRPSVRFARWDLSTIALVNPHTGTILCELYPLDKRKNADRKRRPLERIAPAMGLEPDPGAELAEQVISPGGIAPHLKRLMEQYAATGLPPAYIPHVVRANVARIQNDSNHQQHLSSNPKPDFIDEESQS